MDLTRLVAVATRLVAVPRQLGRELPFGAERGGGGRETALRPERRRPV